MTSPGTASIATSGAPELPVDLGTAGDFTILAKSGITTTGVTLITGDIGVSPIAAAAITGFGLVMDASNQFSTSVLVTGNVYATDYAPPTPTKMSTAVSDMETAFVDAAGRTIPDTTELNAGNLGGLTITAGLHKWSTGVTIPTDLMLSGSATDVWIFQIAQTLDISSATSIVLLGDAKPANIFWQVEGQVTLGTDSIFKGNILCKTAIVLNTGATLSGRALAQMAVTLIANIVSIPTDTTAPAVISTVPTDTAIDVAINSAMSATFSELMDPLTITDVTFTLYDGGTPITGTVTYTGVIAVFTPDSDLSSSTLYTATITTGAEDLAGNKLADDYVWSFTTGAAPDDVAPTVASTDPADGATGVFLGSSISITFSEAMDPLTISTATIVVMQGAAVILGVVTYSGLTAVFTPIIDLIVDENFTVTVTTGVTDLASNAMASDYVFEFDTAVAPVPIIPGWVIAMIVFGIIGIACLLLFLAFHVKSRCATFGSRGECGKHGLCDWKNDSCI